MLPRLVPKILILYAFCDVVVGVGGIGDSRSCVVLIVLYILIAHLSGGIFLPQFDKHQLVNSLADHHHHGEEEVERDVKNHVKGAAHILRH